MKICSYYATQKIKPCYHIMQGLFIEIEKM